MELLATPVHDKRWEAYEVARQSGYRYLWCWYGYNIRLLAMRTSPGASASDYGYMWAWCYERDNGPEAVLEALAAWNPDTQDEPPGYKKRATSYRRAPHRDPDDPLNRDRCEHGGYMADDDCRTAVCHTTIGWRRKRGLPNRPIRLGA